MNIWCNVGIVKNQFSFHSSFLFQDLIDVSDTSSRQERQRLELENAKMQKMQNVPPEPETDAYLGGPWPSGQLVKGVWPRGFYDKIEVQITFYDVNNWERRDHLRMGFLSQNMVQHGLKEKEWKNIL